MKTYLRKLIVPNKYRNKGLIELRKIYGSVQIKDAMIAGELCSTFNFISSTPGIFATEDVTGTEGVALTDAEILAGVYASDLDLQATIEITGYNKDTVGAQEATVTITDRWGGSASCTVNLTIEEA